MVGQAEMQPRPRPQEQGKKINILPLPSSGKAQILDQSRLIREQITLARKDIQPSPLEAILQDRYTTVENIIKAVETIASADNNTPDIEAVFTNALTPLAEKYGFQIVQGKPQTDPDYAQRVQEHAEKYKAIVPQIDEQYLSFKNSQNADKSGVNLYKDTDHIRAGGIFKNHPDIQAYTSIFNSFSDTQKTVYPTTSKTGSYSPSVSLNSSNTRYIYSRKIIDRLFLIGKSVLWEGIDGNTIDLTILASLMNEMLDPLDKGVDLKQPDPNQQNQATPQP